MLNDGTNLQKLESWKLEYNNIEDKNLYSLLINTYLLMFSSFKIYMERNINIFLYG